jgi:regulator of replication initiation timing
MTNTAHSVDLEPIERLAEKVKGLVALLERTRAELSQTVDDNKRLEQEAESLRAALSAAESESAGMNDFVSEREQIRGRVAEMLEQLEGLSL